MNQNFGVVSSLRNETTARTSERSFSFEVEKTGELSRLFGATTIASILKDRGIRALYLLQEMEDDEQVNEEIELLVAQEKAKEAAAKESYRLAHLPPTKIRGHKVDNKAKEALAPKPQELIEAERETRRLERLVLSKVRADRARAEQEKKEAVLQKEREEQLAKERAERAAALARQRALDALRELARKEKLAQEKRQRDLRTRRELERAQLVLQGDGMGMSLSTAPLTGTPRPSQKEICKERVLARKYDDQQRVGKLMEQNRAYQARLLAQLEQ